MPKLIMYTFIGHNSAKYAENLREYCESFKSGAHPIAYRCFRTVSNQQYPITERIPDGWELIEDVEAHPISNSYCHALSLNTAVEHIVNTHDRFNCLIDADTAIVYQDWDKVVINELLKKDIFSWETKTGLPSIFLFAFNREVLDKIQWDFSPLLKEKNGVLLESPEKVRVVTERDSKIYKVKVGDTIKCDTAWRIPEFIYKANLDYSCCKMVRPLSTEALIPYENIKQRVLCHGRNRESHMMEYHWNGELFGSHMQASRTFALDSPRGQAWKSRIEKYLGKEVERCQ